MAKAKRSRVKGYVATRPEQVPGDLMHPARQAEMAAAMAAQGERPERPGLDTSTGAVEKRRMSKPKPKAKAKPKTAAIKRKSPTRKSNGSSRSGGITAAMTSKRMPGQPAKSHR